MLTEMRNLRNDWVEVPHLIRHLPRDLIGSHRMFVRLHPTNITKQQTTTNSFHAAPETTLSASTRFMTEINQSNCHHHHRHYYCDSDTTNEPLSATAHYSCKYHLHRGETCCQFENPVGLCDPNFDLQSKNGRWQEWKHNILLIYRVIGTKTSQ